MKKEKIQKEVLNQSPIPIEIRLWLSKLPSKKRDKLNLRSTLFKIKD